MMITTTTGKRITYELLLKKNSNIDEEHYFSSDVQIMEPDTYGGLLNSPLPVPSNSNRNNYERRHQKQQRQDIKDERIEVKILPQDENWGETTTTTACNGINDETITTINETNLPLNEPIETNSNKINQQRTRTILIYHFLTYFFCLIAVLSPILFLSLPYTLNRSDLILIDDYTLLLTIIFKNFLLIFGCLLLLYRRRNTIYLPNINLLKLFFLIVLIAIILTYWFYYVFKLLQTHIIKYENILSMTSTYEDLLIFLLIITAVTLEIKWLYPKWIVKVVRSPDGQTKSYTIGSMSIQEASVYLLEQYYKDFPVFNPWLENVHQTQARQHGATTTKSVGSQSNASTTGRVTNRDMERSMHGYNDRFYDELDYERRVRKRRTKLLSSCEDAFTHVRRYLNEKSSSYIPMDAREAAQAVFSSMSRSLQKYLRVTRQQPYFTREAIISHLSICLSHDLSPRAFLERYIQCESQPIATLVFPKSSHYNEQSWIIVCDKQNNSNKHKSLNQTIYSNLIFVLKQEHAEHISLTCTFYPIPRVHLIEKIFDLKHNKFVLKLNSETSV